MLNIKKLSFKIIKSINNIMNIYNIILIFMKFRNIFKVDESLINQYEIINLNGEDHYFFINKQKKNFS